MKSMTQFLIDALQRFVIDNPKRSQDERDKAVEAIRDLETNGAPVFDDKSFAERFMRFETDLAFVGNGVNFDLHPAGRIMDLIGDDEADDAFEALAAKEIEPLFLKHGIDIGHTKHCKVCRAAFEAKWPAPNANPKPAGVDAIQDNDDGNDDEADAGADEYDDDH